MLNARRPAQQTPDPLRAAYGALLLAARPLLPPFWPDKSQQSAACSPLLAPQVPAWAGDCRRQSSSVAVSRTRRQTGRAPKSPAPQPSIPVRQCSPNAPKLQGFKAPKQSTAAAQPTAHFLASGPLPSARFRPAWSPRSQVARPTCLVWGCNWGGLVVGELFARAEIGRFCRSWWLAYPSC